MRNELWFCKKYILIVLLFLFTICCSKRESEQIKFIPHYYNLLTHDTDTSYAHYIYIKNNTLHDSAFYKKIALKYIDTVQSHIPVASIEFIDDIQYFDNKTTEQDWEIIKKYRVMSIWFKIETIQTENNKRKYIYQIDSTIIMR